MIGRLVVLSGPSGVGKDTLIRAWAARNPRVVRIVTTTTREPRDGEVEGVDYHFVSTEEFRELADSGAFLEFKNVHGNWYGSPKADVEKHLAEGRIAVLNVDVQGALSVMERRPDALSVFVHPPSLEELERRIRRRGLDSEEAIQRRLENARGEIEQAARYSFQLVNDDLAKAVDELESLLSAGR